MNEQEHAMKMSSPSRLRFRFPLALAVVLTLLAGALPVASQPLQFHSLNPCRLVDTRGATSSTGGPALNNRTNRSFTVRGACGVPASAEAVAMNVTVVRQTATGHITVWPQDQSLPTASMLNFSVDGGATANGTLVALGATSPGLSVRPDMGPGSSTVDLILDITGYFD